MNKLNNFINELMYKHNFAEQITDFLENNSNKKVMIVSRSNNTNTIEITLTNFKKIIIFFDEKDLKFTHIYNETCKNLEELELLECIEFTEKLKNFLRNYFNSKEIENLRKKYLET